MKFKKTKPVNTPKIEPIVGGEVASEQSFSRKKKTLIISFVFVLIVAGAAGGYYFWYAKDNQSNQNTLAQSKDNYNDKLQKANSNPEDVAAQNEAAVATGQLAQEYVQSGNVDKAIEIAAGDTIPKLEAQSLALQQKADWAGALAVHKQLLEEYKKLPDDNPTKKSEIERAERKIQELSEQV